jgi:hypothetical protein
LLRFQALVKNEVHENDSRYAIRLANQDIVFVEETDWNILADDITIN